MLKNKKNNFGGGKRIVMVGEEDIIDFGEEFGIVKFAGPEDAPGLHRRRTWFYSRRRTASTY